MQIGLFTSGGDSPGMNAAIRSVVRSALSMGHSVYGYNNGFEGLIKNDFQVMSLRSVANIIHQGGTILKTTRSPAFFTENGRARAYENLVQNNIQILVGLGGDGTIKGLEVFNSEYKDMRTIGLPCTIDNDCFFTEDCVGYDTATNTAVEAIDRVRDTAGSHQRTFVIEVMGRSFSDLAFSVGLSAGAEYVLDLNVKENLEDCVQAVSRSIDKGKRASLIVVLESDKKNNSVSAAHVVTSELEKRLKIDCRALVLGHIQRGGRPTSHDRILASIMGYQLALAIEEHETSGVIIKKKGKILFSSFEHLKKVQDSQNHLELIKTLSL